MRCTVCMPDASVNGSNLLRREGFRNRVQDATWRVRVVLRRVQACENFKHDHAKRVHLASLREAHGALVNGALVSRRAANGLVGDVMLADLPRGAAAEAEVSHLGLPVAVEKHVGGLDVPMKRLGRGVVHVRQARRRVQQDAEAVVPQEPISPHASGLVTAVQTLEHVSAGEELVHQVSAAVLLAPPQQGHQIRVPELAQHHHFLLEAALVRHRRGAQLDRLDGDLGAILHLAPVHSAVAAGAQLPRGVPRARGLGQLRLRVLQGDGP
mmetsp:Transcript_25504/g.76678  ORF Transcript_25504/g.76678 Transcript_25504/m.76678 type:complete len:268 (+) Transcript_25504:241-1044(+)